MRRAPTATETPQKGDQTKPPAATLMYRAVLTAALILVVALIIYAVASDPTWTNKSYWLAQADRAGGAGRGGEAGRARPARARMTPRDHLRAAATITRDLLEQAPRPVFDRQTGAPTQATLDRARARRGLYDRARGHYLAALGTAPGAPEAAPEPHRPQGPGAGAARAAPGARAHLNAAQGAIDAAFGFAHEGWETVFADDVAMAVFLAAGGAPDIFGGAPFGVQFALVDRPLAVAAEARQDDVLQARQRVAAEVAAAQGAAGGAAAATYVDLATQHTDDPQNAHDTGVIACLRAVVARLREDQGPLDQVPPLQRVVDDLRTNGPRYSAIRGLGRPQVVADAVAVAERAAAGERVIALGATDEECLRRVWARADDPRNAATRGGLRQSLFDNLADCWEETGVGRAIVCVNGRASRILSALVLLDWDKRNWTVKKLEQFKNDIFERAGRLINEIARQAADAGDPAGRLFLSGSFEETAAIGEVAPEAEARLADRMREGIDRMVDDYIADLENEAGLVGVIPDFMVAKTKREAKAAVV